MVQMVVKWRFGHIMLTDYAVIQFWGFQCTLREGGGSA